MSSSSFTGLLLIHRLVGKSGLANLLRGVVKKVSESNPSAAGGAGNGNVPVGSTSSTLYVYLWKNPLTDISSLSRFTTLFYAQASSICPAVDVRLLLQNQIPKAVTITTPKPRSIVPPGSSFDAVFVDSGIPKADVTTFLAEHSIPDSDHIPQHIIFDEDVNGDEDETDATPKSACGTADNVFDVVAIGGTFDRIHNGHKLLVSEAILRCRHELIIGVTDEEMIKSKSLSDLIAPVQDRMKAVHDLALEIAPSTLKFRMVPLSDSFGPTITDPSVGLLVVSPETFKVGAKMNAIRKERNFPEAEVYSIQLFAESNKQSDHEEDKISSSSIRLRSLGDRLRAPNKPASLPYIIGLTGGIASGKSTIAKYLESLGAGMIDCDKLGHEAYTKGTACYDKIVALFGPNVVNSETGGINRRAIGKLVFGKPDILKQLTDIVWPEIQRLVELKIQDFAKSGVKIVILDAAVLIEAKWDAFCHEVWVPFVSRDEAVRRIQERDNLSAEDAQRRIDSQLPNKERLKHATFAFSSLWEVEFTREQVRKAWAQIEDLIKDL